jgi:hypothetical protein
MSEGSELGGEGLMMISNSALDFDIFHDIS